MHNEIKKIAIFLLINAILLFCFISVSLASDLVKIEEISTVIDSIANKNDRWLFILGWGFSVVAGVIALRYQTEQLVFKDKRLEEKEKQTIELLRTTISDNTKSYEKLSSAIDRIMDKIK